MSEPVGRMTDARFREIREALLEHGWVPEHPDHLLRQALELLDDAERFRRDEDSYRLVLRAQEVLIPELIALRERVAAITHEPMPRLLYIKLRMMAKERQQRALNEGGRLAAMPWDDLIHELERWFGAAPR